ncbi:MAG: DNA/RNA nuclease SfsA [Clostridiales bacterium]|nr:DNA/RNA nuclease SfsA [Clostridiales bacterium]
MKYENTKKAVFIDRPNRFIANIALSGGVEACHIKNTGRLGELLLPGADMIVQQRDQKTRRTKYDLIAVYKNARLVNVDSQAPNRVFAEWLRGGGLFRNLTLLRPECRFGNSRLDFYIEADGRRIFVETKGVTLEDGGVALFPDAPTERGKRHLNELISCVKKGFSAYAVFIVQMKGVRYFAPNAHTHAAFAKTLKEASEAGVRIIALDCDVCHNSLEISDFVDVRLNP